MKQCVCVVIVLFSYAVTRLGIFLAFYSKTQKNENQHLGHSFFIFCFTDFLDLFLLLEDEKKLK